MSFRARTWTAGLAIAALVVVGGAVPADAAPVDRAAELRQQILDRVRQAAAPVQSETVSLDDGDDAPAAEATIQPGAGAVLDAASAGVRADFSGHAIDEPLDVHAASLGEGAAVSAASETGGVVAATPLEIRAHTSDGDDVTRFPASYTIEKDSSGIEVAKDVEPGVRLELQVDAARLTRAGVDVSSLRVYSRENPGEPWRMLPSYFDADAGTVKAESEHLSQFVVIGTPVQTTPVPRIVLDPDDDVGWANSPGPRITELPLNVRLADQLAGMFRDRCIADVTVTRGADQRFVSADTRRAIAASHNPDVMLTIAFNALTGNAWGIRSEGGTQLFSRGGDSDALRGSLLAEMPAYTGRPAKVKSATADFPREEYQGLPGAVVHMETLFMDNNYDRPVIDGGWDAIANGAFTGVGKYLEARGFSCTNPITGGWPARPSAQDLARWYQLGYRNWQHYGADPVSFSTGNLVESEHLFSLSGTGGQATDVSLVYNAQDGRLTRTGAGWSFGLGGRAQRFDDHSVLVVRGDGSSIMFEPDGAGGYVDASSEGLHLAEAGGGVLRMTSRTGESWDYDASDQDGIGELVRATDAAGRTTTLTYGAASRSQQFVPLTQITDAAGQTVRVDSDSLGRITGFTLPDGRGWSLGYDGAGDLVRLGSPDGGAKTFTYDGAHRIVTMTDALGATYLGNAYDGAGRVVQQWDAAGNERRFDYRAGETVYTDQEGRAHTYAFDSRSRVTRITGPAGDIQSWTYDVNDQVASYTDAAGHTTAYAYDSAGNVAAVTDAAGGVTRYTYTPTGKVASRTDPLGRVTSYAYDARGALTGMVLPDGSTIAYTVDAAGNTTGMTLPSGADYTFEVDAHGNRTKSTDPLGRVSTFAYDAANRLVASTDPAGNVTRYAWDARDKVTAVTDPLGRTTRYGYDLNGNLTSATDPAGNVTSYTWDALFRVVSATNAAGGTTTYTYDREDGLTGTTDAAGRQTSFVLDALSRVTETTDPAGQVWRSSYDASGALTSQTDPAGQVTSQTVDELGRVTSVSGPTGIGQHTVYDAVGRVTAVSDADGRETGYEYDLLDRVTAVIDPAGHRTTYRYDVDGLLVGVIDRLGNPTLYERDAAGQVTTVTDPTGATSAYSYDPAGRVTAVTDATGRTVSYTYDAAGQLTRATDAAGHATSYTYDAVGNVTAVTDPNGHITTATWDALGHRTSTTNALGDTYRYAYDAAGQLTAATDPLGHQAVYTYEARGQLASVTDPLGGVTRYTYDPLGQLAQLTDARGKTTTYSYDAAGQPSTTTDAAGHTVRYEYGRRGLLDRVTLASGATIAYGYDAVGNRVEQSSASDVAHFEYDAEQRLIAASNRAGTTGWTYSPAGRVTAQIDAQGRELDYAYDAAGALTALTVPGGDTITYDRDTTGRVSRMSSPWGTAGYTYDPAGNVTGIDRSNGVTTGYTYDGADQVTQITATTPDPAAPVPATAATGPVRTEGLCPVITNQNASSLRAANVDRPGCVKPSSYLARRTLPTDTGSLTQGASLSIGYTYDAAGNVTGSTRTATAPTAALPGGVAPAGAPTTAGAVSTDPAVTVLDRVTTAYTYDAGDRLVISHSSTGAADAYAYDAAGNRTSWIHTAATVSSGVLDPALGIDASGASIPRPAASVATGTVQATDAGFTQSQVFNDLNQVVSSTSTLTGEQRFAYDPDGHRVSSTGGAGDTSLWWNELGQLTGYDTSTTSTSFGYDALGRRVSSQAQTALGVTSTATVWDGLTPVQDTNTAAGTTTLVRDVAGDLLLEGRTTGAAVWDLLDRLGTAVAQVGDTRLGTALNNPVQAAADAGADRSARITQVAGAGDWGSLGFSTSGWAASVGYTGERADPTTGVGLFYSRGYDTRTGSWLSPDAWTGNPGDPATLNRYGYVTGNPTTTRDILGYRPLGRYDKATDSLYLGKAASLNAPGAQAGMPWWTKPLFGPQQPTSQPGGKQNSRSRTSSSPTPPQPITPHSISYGTGRHHTIALNPLTMTASDWQDIGAPILGLLGGALITAGVLALAGCTIATVGLCGVGAVIAAGAIGGAAGGALSYGLASGQKTPEGYAGAIGGGAVLGGVGGAVVGAAGRTAANAALQASITSRATASGVDASQGFPTFAAAKKALGPAGEGNVYDHIVEQCQINCNRSAFDPNIIHNPYNLDPVPAWVNQAKANYYSSKFDFTGNQTVREWLSGKSYDFQHQFGLSISQGIVNGDILP